MEEEELDTLKILESNEIIKELDSGKPISEIDVDQLVVDSPFEKNFRGILFKYTQS